MKTPRALPITRSASLAFPALLLGLLVVAIQWGSLHAQEVKSRPVGFLTQTIPAGQTASFSIPFDPDVSSRPDAIRRVSGLGATYIDSEGAAWAPGAFSAPSAPYAVRVTSGQASGRIFLVSSTANTASRLYLETDGLDLTSLQIESGTAGASFEVLPADTLATFFGSNTPGDALVVQGAADARGADLVQLWAGSGWKRYYFNTLWNRWALDSDTEVDAARNHALLRPDRGIMITRRGDTPLVMAVVGRVLSVPHRAVQLGSDNLQSLLATMQPGDISLGNLALQRSDRVSGWRSSSDPSQADILSVWSGATWLSFFHNDSAGYWQRVGDSGSNRDEFMIRAGVPVFVQRRNSAAGTQERTIAFPAALP
ncbi:MAG: hypothetical protein RIR76_2413 [Verrucomicrobiota bacterium]|jgi:hypothetical protein